MTLYAPNGSAPWAQLAGRLLRSGELVAIPTETVYGLAANAYDAAAVRRIFEAKGRPPDNPLIAHIAHPGQLSGLTSRVDDTVLSLARAFWPGPLTLVLPRGPRVPDEVTAGLPTVAVRCPAHDDARRIILAAGVPLAAPSANRSGRPSPTEARHVLRDLSGRISLVVDGGRCTCGIESTVFDVGRRVILRPGAVGADDLASVAGPLGAPSGPHADDRPCSPGMKYRHYAPRAPLTILRGTAQRAAAFVSAGDGPNTGVLCFDEEAGLFSAGTVIAYGRRSEPRELAQNLFGALRAFDDTGVTVIYARCPEGGPIGDAVADRLLRAADSREIRLDGDV